VLTAFIITAMITLIMEVVSTCEEPFSSVSIVAGYGLDDQAIEVRSLAEAKGFSCSFCVHTDSGAHPACYTMGTGCKVRLGRDADHSPQSSAEVVNE
jgi:hypothetical protein